MAPEKSPLNVPQSPHADLSSGTLQEDKEFKLAPTPAQLGKAPLQRRQSLGTYLINISIPQKMLRTKYFTAVMSSSTQMTTETVPVSNADDSQSESALISPSTKKSFFKKNIEDGMDK